MKGYIEHLIVSTEEFERELEREYQRTEIPYQADAYKKWMQTRDNKTENVANAYVSYIRSTDKELFLFEDDFFYLLPEKIKAGDFEGVTALFKQYLSIIDNWYEDSTQKDVGIPKKKISDWRSGFRNYQKFIVEWLIPDIKKRLKEEGNVSINLPECKRLFAEEDFRTWLVDNSVSSEGSINSYISRLKRVNQVVSKHFTTVTERPIDAFHTYIAKNVQDQKGIVAHDFLVKLIHKFKQKINQQDESLMPLNALRSCNSALRKYSQFIMEDCVIEIPDEEDTATFTYAADKNNTTDTIIAYDYEVIAAKFQLRLFTQNRMSKNKDVFFPIGIIRQLFCKSEKKSRMDGKSNDCYKWLMKWANNCIAEIDVITDKGHTTVGMLAENDTLTLNQNTNEWVVNSLDDKGMARLMTDTGKDGETPVPMRVKKLDDIHIDHTPLMCQILSDNMHQLPALVHLTDIIRTTAHQNKIAITTKNFVQIGKKVINDADRFVEMEKLIPALKQELELIRNASTLQLMAAEYNLKKKL